MSARPHFLRGFTPRDFDSTSGHTQPAVARPPQAVDLVVSEGGARLDTHRVFPAKDWISDGDLAKLAQKAPTWAGQSMAERQRRAATRKRLQEIREEMQISRREWLLWLLVCVLAILLSAWAPEHWASYGAGWRPW